MSNQQPYHIQNPEAIGVTTSADMMHARTKFDINMNCVFNPQFAKYNPFPGHTYEAYQKGQRQSHKEMYSYRTSFDKHMQAEFNPLYRHSMKTREAYKGKGKKEQYQPRHSKLHDDPYMPYSYQTLQPDFQ